MPCCLLTVGALGTGISDHSNDLTPIVIDVDNDAAPDTIIPRVFRLNDSRKLTDWIAFDLKSWKGHVLKSFFGTSIGITWRSTGHMRSCPVISIRMDELTRLLFRR